MFFPAPGLHNRDIPESIRRTEPVTPCTNTDRTMVDILKAHAIKTPDELEAVLGGPLCTRAILAAVNMRAARAAFIERCILNSPKQGCDDVAFAAASAWDVMHPRPATVVSIVAKQDPAE